MSPKFRILRGIQIEQRMEEGIESRSGKHFFRNSFLPLKSDIVRLLLSICLTKIIFAKSFQFT